MFFRRKSADHPLADAPLYAIGLSVRPGTEQFPPPLTGALVTVFCTAPDATAAAWTAIQAIEAMGYSVPGNPSSVHLMRVADWEQFALSTWPGLELATQAEVYERIADHRVVLGPFGGFTD